MKKLRNITIAVFIGLVFVVNITTVVSKTQRGDFSLNQIIGLAHASESEGNNEHDGYKWDFAKACCAQSSSHSDRCNGKLC